MIGNVTLGRWVCALSYISRVGFERCVLWLHWSGTVEFLEHFCSVLQDGGVYDVDFIILSEVDPTVEANVPISF